jgi:hypothetical protein
VDNTEPLIGTYASSPPGYFTKMNLRTSYGARYLNIGADTIHLLAGHKFSRKFKNGVIIKGTWEKDGEKSSFKYHLNDSTFVKPFIFKKNHLYMIDNFISCGTSEHRKLFMAFKRVK